MPNLWRVGILHKHNVVNETGDVVCMCYDAATAAKIVEAVNRMTTERTALLNAVKSMVDAATAKAEEG